MKVLAKLVAVTGLVFAAVVLVVVMPRGGQEEGLVSTQSGLDSGSGESAVRDVFGLEPDDPTAELTSSSSFEEILTALNPCPPGIQLSQRAFSDSYPRVAEWIYVDSRSDSISGDDEFDPLTTEFVTEGGAILEISHGPDDWFAVDWGLRDPGVRVLLGLPNDASRISWTSFELDDGRVFFPGTCLGGLNRSLDSFYGADLQGVLAEARSLPLLEAQEFLRTGGGRIVPAPVVEQPVILNPSTVSGELLDSLQFALVVATIDEVPKAPSTICTKSPAGWGDCFFADAETLARGVDVDAYLDDSGVLELWLTDEFANLTKPIRLLGSVTVPVGLRDTEYGVAVSVDIKIADSTVTERRLVDLADFDLNDPVWGPYHQDWLDSGGTMVLPVIDAARAAE